MFFFNDELNYSCLDKTLDIFRTDSEYALFHVSLDCVNSRLYLT